MTKRFKSCIAIYCTLRPSWRTRYQATGEAFSSPKRTSSSSKRENSSLFSFFVCHFCLPGSVSRFRNRIRIHKLNWIRIQSGSRSETLEYMKAYDGKKLNFFIFRFLKPSFNEWPVEIPSKKRQNRLHLLNPNCSLSSLKNSLRSKFASQNLCVKKHTNIHRSVTPVYISNLESRI